MLCDAIKEAMKKCIPYNNSFYNHYNLICSLKQFN